MSFVNHTRTRHCKNASLVLKVPRCKTSTFQSSFFNRIAPLWNCICALASPDDFLSIVSFKTFLSRTYLDLMTITFDLNMTCSWSLCRSCSCHMGEMKYYVSTYQVLRHWLSVADGMSECAWNACGYHKYD